MAAPWSSAKPVRAESAPATRVTCGIKMSSVQLLIFCAATVYKIALTPEKAMSKLVRLNGIPN